jgi:SRSO17 transposase
LTPNEASEEIAPLQTREEHMPSGRRATSDVDVGALTAMDVSELAVRLVEFMKPYQALMGLAPHREHVGTFVEGLVSGLERKSVEPIARSHGMDRQPLQHFVGVSPWKERPLLTQLRSEIAVELGDDDAVLIIDGSGVPKKGTESVGVTRQWCGRLGKVENCQVGIYLAYAGKGAAALFDRRMYLPREWAKDRKRRAKVHVPTDVRFKKAWELADEMLRDNAGHLPHGWVVGDDEYGRCTRFRDRLSERGERYMLEVPSNTAVRKVRGAVGRPPTWHSAAEFARRRPVSDWTRFRVRDGEKGPIEVRAITARVHTRRRKGGPREEIILVMETLDGSDRWVFLTNAKRRVPLAKLVEVASRRHLIEEAFALGKGDVGLDHYEVRTWQGWHHHTACALLGGWFLVREDRRLGKKSAATDCLPGPVCVE